jgi:hypothetical protein
MEEGRHPEEEREPEFDDRADVESEASFEAAVDEGFETAYSTPPDVLTWEYLPDTNDRDILVAFLDSYQNGQTEQGEAGLSHEEYQRLIAEALANYSGPSYPNPEERAFNAMGS